MLKGSNKTEYQKEYMRKKREGLTYPAIILALADKDRRSKLIKITAQLKAHKVLDSVRYGIAGPTFTEVDKMLAVLGAKTL